jgi:hypothetical protein
VLVTDDGEVFEFLAARQMWQFDSILVIRKRKRAAIRRAKCRTEPVHNPERGASIPAYPAGRLTRCARAVQSLGQPLRQEVVAALMNGARDMGVQVQEPFIRIVVAGMRAGTPITGEGMG